MGGGRAASSLTSSRCKGKVEEEDLWACMRDTEQGAGAAVVSDKGKVVVDVWEEGSRSCEQSLDFTGSERLEVPDELTLLVSPPEKVVSGVAAPREEEEEDECVVMGAGKEDVDPFRCSWLSRVRTAKDLDRGE